MSGYQFIVIIKHETDFAILVDHDGAEEVWLPKSQISRREDDALKGLTAITIPEWLATDKGML